MLLACAATCPGRPWECCSPSHLTGGPVEANAGLVMKRSSRRSAKANDALVASG